MPAPRGTTGAVDGAPIGVVVIGGTRGTPISAWTGPGGGGGMAGSIGGGGISVAPTRPRMNPVAASTAPATMRPRPTGACILPSHEVRIQLVWRYVGPT